jgi:hypothetical protein
VEESAPKEAVTPDDRAPEEIEEAPELEQKDFGDRLVQAMQKRAEQGSEP